MTNWSFLGGKSDFLCYFHPKIASVKLGKSTPKSYRMGLSPPPVRKVSIETWLFFLDGFPKYQGFIFSRLEVLWCACFSQSAWLWRLGSGRSRRCSRRPPWCCCRSWTSANTSSSQQCGWKVGGGRKEQGYPSATQLLFLLQSLTGLESILERGCY